jgi:NAD(P)H-flavin reductase/ferredoxin
MPMLELTVGEQRLTVAPASNLLDALLQGGVAVPYSCRSGSCHACMVRCLRGEPLDARPDALDPQRREQGWRLACQCRIVDDLQVEVFDPLRDGRPTRIDACDWLTPDVLRLRLMLQQPLRYRAGQHLVLWTDTGIARPYSLASLPGEDPWLEFHLECRQPGAFSDAARTFKPGDALRIGELRGGALHYDPDWQMRPLWLLAAGTGLAPLYGVLREALRLDHQGGIRVIHLGHDRADHYLAEPLAQLAAQHSQLQVELLSAAELPAALAELRLVSRQTIALLCGHPDSVERFTRRLYLAGMPRNQMFADLFLPYAR